MRKTTFTGPRHLRRAKRARHHKVLKRQRRAIKAALAKYNSDGKIRGVWLPGRRNRHGVRISAGRAMQLTAWTSSARYSTVVIPEYEPPVPPKGGAAIAVALINAVTELLEYKPRGDIYRIAYAMVFGGKPGDVTPQQRQMVKTVSFGAAYGARNPLGGGRD